MKIISAYICATYIAQAIDLSARSRPVFRSYFIFCGAINANFNVFVCESL